MMFNLRSITLAEVMGCPYIGNAGAGPRRMYRVKGLIIVTSRGMIWVRRRM